MILFSYNNTYNDKVIYFSLLILCLFKSYSLECF